MCAYWRGMAMAESQDPTSSSSFFSWRYKVWAHRRRMASLNSTSAPIPPEESRRWVAETIWNLFMETNMPSFPSSLSFFLVLKGWAGLPDQPIASQNAEKWDSTGSSYGVYLNYGHLNGKMIMKILVWWILELSQLSQKFSYSQNLFGCTSKSSRSGKPQHAGHAEAVEAAEALEAMAGRPLYSSGPQGAIDSCSFGWYFRAHLMSSKRGSWSHACNGCDFLFT